MLPLTAFRQEYLQHGSISATEGFIVLFGHQRVLKSAEQTACIFSTLPGYRGHTVLRESARDASSVPPPQGLLTMAGQDSGEWALCMGGRHAITSWARLAPTRRPSSGSRAQSLPGPFH